MVELKKLEMPEKLLDASADDKKLDLQKQIGCISGIFRMFDRRHLLAGRSLSDRSHRKLPSGNNPLKTPSILLNCLQNVRDTLLKDHLGVLVLGL